MFKRRLISALLTFSLLISGCSFLGKKDTKTEEDISFSGWSDKSQKDVSIDKTDPSARVCLFFNNPQLREIVSLTINNEVYTSNSFINDRYHYVTNANQVSLEIKLPKEIGTYQFSLNSFKYIEDKESKESIVTTSNSHSIRVYDPSDEPVDSITIYHCFDEKGEATLQEVVRDYKTLHPNLNIYIDVCFIGTPTDATANIMTRALVEREKAIVLGVLEKDDFEYYHSHVKFNRIDELMSNDKMTTANEGLLEACSDGSGHLDCFPVHWNTSLALVNKTILSSYFGGNYENKLSSYESYHNLFSDSKTILYPYFGKTIFESQPITVLSNYLTVKGYDLPIVNNEENYAYMHNMFEEIYSLLDCSGVFVADNDDSFAYEDFKEQKNLICGQQYLNRIETVEEDVDFDVDYLACGFDGVVNGNIVGAYYLDLGDISESADSTEADIFAKYMFDNVFSDGDFQFNSSTHNYFPSNDAKMEEIALDSEAPRYMKYCFNNDVLNRLAVCKVKRARIFDLCSAYMYSINADHATNYYFNLVSHYNNYWFFQ